MRALAEPAARLSCPDERFAEFAAATGVEVGPLEPDERDALRADIDARVAHAYGLSGEELEVVFSRLHPGRRAARLPRARARTVREHCRCRSRPHLLDNAPAGREHAEALAYLIGDTDVRHPLAVATGYVNLGGLHHLATLADGRPTRLLIGAEPHAGSRRRHRR